MPEYRSLLAKDPSRLSAVDDLVTRLKTRDAKTAARFSEAGRNFAEEANLEGAFWLELADLLLLRGTSLPLPDVENELRLLFRKFQKMGPKVMVPRTRHGKLFKRTDFLNRLINSKSGRKTLPKKKAEAIINRLLVSGPTQAARTLRFRELGSFLMWSTYCETCDCNDPFNPRMSAEKFVDSLGLIFKTGEQFLVFVYEIPSGVDRFTPTIADAYGGSFFFPFRTGGRTNPIRYQDELSGRPEVIHEPILGRFVKEAVELLEPVG